MEFAPTVTGGIVANMFGRLGRYADVKRQIKLAEDVGGSVVEDKEAGTVEAIMPPAAVMFRAIEKGEGVWLVMYNDYFYGRGNR